MSKITIVEVDGMTCSGCVSSVEKALKRVPGVVTAQVDLETGRARVEGDLPAETLIAAVEKAGYGAKAGATS